MKKNLFAFLVIAAALTVALPAQNKTPTFDDFLAFDASDMSFNEKFVILPEAPKSEAAFDEDIHFGTPAKPPATAPEPAPQTQPATPPAAQEISAKPIVPETLREEADDKILEELVSDQAKLLRDINEDPEIKRLPHAEKERRLAEIAKRYERFLLRNPRDITARILYGKFLRLIDSRKAANEHFLLADAGDPNVAIVKNQLGLYAAEEGNFAKALPFLERATELAPATAVYWYQLGEFLSTYKNHLVEKKLLARTAADEKMQDAFRHAAILNPKETGYRWRYAESFFDCSEKNWHAALGAWEVLNNDAKTPLEHEVLGLYRARILIELGLRDQAQQIIDASQTPTLEVSRQRLRAMLSTAPQATLPPTINKMPPAKTEPPAPAIIAQPPVTPMRITTTTPPIRISAVQETTPPVAKAEKSTTIISETPAATVLIPPAIEPLPAPETQTGNSQVFGDDGWF